MSDNFNPYHKWLGIPHNHQPPNHYRLLGIEDFESDGDVITHAADQRMAHVKSFHAGPHSDLSQKILNEIAAARACLHDPQNKTAYDTELRTAQKPLQSPPVLPDSSGEAVLSPAADSFDFTSVTDSADSPKVADARAENVTDLDFDAEAGDVQTTSYKKSAQKKEKKIAVVGHIIAPLVGLGLGWLVLQMFFNEESATSEKAVGRQETQSSLATATKAPTSNDETKAPSPLQDQPTLDGPDEQRMEPVEVETLPPAVVVTKPPPPQAEKKAPPPPSPAEQLQLAQKNGNVQAAFDLLEQHHALHGKNLLTTKLDLLEALRDTIHDPKNDRLAAEQSLALVEQVRSSGSGKLLSTAIDQLVYFGGKSADAPLRERATNVLVELAGSLVAQGNVPVALQLVEGNSKLNDTPLQDGQLALLKQTNDQAASPQQFIVVARFATTLLAQAEDCQDRDFLDTCAKIATIAARKAQNSNVLRSVTLEVVNLNDKCADQE